MVIYKRFVGTETETEHPEQAGLNPKMADTMAGLYTYLRL